MQAVTKAPAPLAPGSRSWKTAPMNTLPHTVWRPRTAPEVEALAQRHPAHAPALLGHLRWCLHTPAADIVVVQADQHHHALATLLWQAGSLQVLRWLLHAPHHADALRATVCRVLMAEQALRPGAPLLLQTLPAEAAWWQHAGFAEQVALETWAADPEQPMAEPGRDEVVPLEAVHTLALLHLDRQATGEDRGSWLLEHGYAARTFASAGRVHGVLLPLLGHGLILADRPQAGLELQRWLLPVQQRIVVPEGNTAAAAHLQQHGYAVVSTDLRLVHGPMPRFDPHLVYAWPW